jgi:hypothetical protein
MPGANFDMAALPSINGERTPSTPSSGGNESVPNCCAEATQITTATSGAVSHGLHRSLIRIGQVSGIDRFDDRAIRISLVP